MIVTSTGIKDGVIEDKYGKFGTQFNENHILTYSLPFEIKEAPEKSVSYAIVLEDKDAYPLVGFSWVHWVAANITKTTVQENESIGAKDFVQGVNSWVCAQGGELSKESCSIYGGMNPPEAPHLYELHVYALDKKLNLENGFYMNELYKQMDGHVLDSYTLKGIYKSEK